MLRIVVNTDTITFQLWSGVGSQSNKPTRTYPNDPAHLAKLESMLQARRVYHPETVDQREYNGDTIYIIRPVKRYQFVFGTAYDRRTNGDLVLKLDRIRQFGSRVRVTYGNPLTGVIWGVDERHPNGDQECGYIGRSMGRVKIPLLIPNARSTGGGGLLDHCIVRLEYSNKKKGGVIWQAPPLK